MNIGVYPLWVVVVCWALQRRALPRVNVVDYERWLKLLNDLMYSLPLPQGRLEKWIVERIFDYIHQEETAVVMLRATGVVVSGVVDR